MNVHVVCSRLKADRVLPRLAKTLAEETGWTIGEIPNPSAELNYYFPYLELQRREHEGNSLSVAWFTHKDTANPKKAEVWDNVADRLDLRTLTAKKYLPDLEPFGPVAMVRPPVELDRFVPKRRTERRKKKTVGLSGYLYGDNRKGEDLIQKLVKSGPDCDWQASGRGWPVRTKSYSWQDMPSFYQSLDVYVCASRIEGIPMPPLEALATGVPIVIPHGVGLLDDLPKKRGIYRFKPGDYKSLQEALSRALDGQSVKKESLREAVLQYSAKNWAHDHRKAFERLLYKTGPFEGESKAQQKGLAGIYCVAFGEPSRKCARRLIQSIRLHMPDMPVMFVGTEALNAGETYFLEQEDKDIGGRWAKLAIDRHAPREWDYVLYLDADTELLEPVNFLFDVLRSGWEFVICKDMGNRDYLKTMNRGDNREEASTTEFEIGSGEVMQYNGGVFGFRRTEATRRFFEAWNFEYDRWCGRDQGALLRAFHKNPLRTFVLLNQWNASDRVEAPNGNVAIAHHNVEARRWQFGRRIYGRLDDEQAWHAVKQWEKNNP